MTDNLKGLLAKAWKDETIELEPGRYFCDEVLTVRVTGTVEKLDDEFVALLSASRSFPPSPVLGEVRDYS